MGGLFILVISAVHCTHQNEIHVQKMILTKVSKAHTFFSIPVPIHSYNISGHAGDIFVTRDDKLMFCILTPSCNAESREQLWRERSLLLPISVMVGMP